MKTINIDMDRLIDALDTAFSAMDFSSVIRLVEPEIRWCEDCEQFYHDEDGGFYKYEDSLWLCQDDLDKRMEEE